MGSKVGCWCTFKLSTTLTNVSIQSRIIVYTLSHRCTARSFPYLRSDVAVLTEIEDFLFLYTTTYVTQRRPFIERSLWELQDQAHHLWTTSDAPFWGMYWYTVLVCKGWKWRYMHWLHAPPLLYISIAIAYLPLRSSALHWWKMKPSSISPSSVDLKLTF